MKQIFLLLLVVGCRQAIAPVPRNIQAVDMDTVRASIDSMTADVVRHLDSNFAITSGIIETAMKNKEFRFKSDSCYIVYLQTGSRKALKWCNRYIDSANSYVNKNNSYFK